MRKDRKQAKKSTRLRIRSKVAGTAQRPRVAVFRSTQHFYMQVVDDAAGTTLASVSTREAELLKKAEGNGGNVKAADVLGTVLADRLKEKGIENIVFDRGGFVYHGRVKAAAEAMRKAGIKF